MYILFLVRVCIHKKKEAFTVFVFICKFARDRLSSKYLDLDPSSSCNEHESGTQNFRGASFTKDNQVDFLVPLPPRFSSYSPTSGRKRDIRNVGY